MLNKCSLLFSPSRSVQHSGGDTAINTAGGNSSRSRRRHETVASGGDDGAVFTSCQAVKSFTLTLSFGLCKDSTKRCSFPCFTQRQSGVLGCGSSAPASSHQSWFARPSAAP